MLILIPPALLGTGNAGAVSGKVWICFRANALLVSLDESSGASDTALLLLVPPSLGRASFTLASDWVPEVWRAAGNTFVVSCNERL